MKRFFPEIDYPDLPLEEARLRIAMDMLDAACLCEDGIPAAIINPTLHAQAIKLGTDALLAVRAKARRRKAAAGEETGGHSAAAVGEGATNKDRIRRR
jgi:hypothetical protein